MAKKKDIDRKAVEQLGKAHRGEISLKSALLDLGFSEAQSDKGWAKVKNSAYLREALAAAKSEELSEIVSVGRNIDASTQENLVRGKLVQNALAGKDHAVGSLKLLGQDKRVNMFTPDSVTGVFIMEVPKNLPPLPHHIEGFDIGMDREGHNLEGQKK